LKRSESPTQECALWTVGDYTTHDSANK